VKNTNNGGEAISLIEGAILSRAKGGRAFGEKRIKGNVLPKLTEGQAVRFNG
jgi:hypothetical protein